MNKENKKKISNKLRKYSDELNENILMIKIIQIMRLLIPYYPF